MNIENIEFLERNDINIYEINQSVNCHIYSLEEENPIVANYNFQKPAKLGETSISKIIGYDTNFRSIPANLILSMDYYFNANGDGYHSRSVGMLKYTKEDIIENLKESFKTEPISVIETGEGNYTILSNGLHRYTLLRILYLSEIAQAKGNEEKIQEINKKYTIPVEITEVDLEKTYCKYLLMENQVIGEEGSSIAIRDIRTYYDQEYRRTDKVEIIYNDATKKILDSDELIRYTRDFIKENDEKLNITYDVINDYNKYKSFKKFIDENFSDIFKLNEQNIDERSGSEDDRID